MASDLIERLKKCALGSADEDVMVRWDKIRAILKQDKGGTWPRDCFESIIDAYAEDCEDAVKEITALRTALAIERERADKAEALADRLKLEAQIHAGEARCANDTINQAYRAVTGGTGEPGNWHGAEPIKQALAETRASLAEAKRLLDWQPMESAPRDGTIVNVLGRYVCASAGFPRYAGYEAETDRWMEYTRHQPEPLTVWAWRPREDWPDESARFLAQEEGR